jgi:hypothetical protein
VDETPHRHNAILTLWRKSHAGLRVLGIHGVCSPFVWNSGVADPLTQKYHGLVRDLWFCIFSSAAISPSCECRCHGAIGLTPCLPMSCRLYDSLTFGGRLVQLLPSSVASSGAPVLMSPLALYCRARRLLEEARCGRVDRWACSLCRRRSSLEMRAVPPQYYLRASVRRFVAYCPQACAT